VIAARREAGARGGEEELLAPGSGAAPRRALASPRHRADAALPGIAAYRAFLPARAAGDAGATCAEPSSAAQCEVSKPSPPTLRYVYRCVEERTRDLRLVILAQRGSRRRTERHRRDGRRCIGFHRRRRAAPLPVCHMGLTRATAARPAFERLSRASSGRAGRRYSFEEDTPRCGPG